MKAIFNLSPPWRGAFLVALSGTLFGLLGWLGTQLFNAHFSLENMLFWRFLMATVWVACICGMSQEKLLPRDSHPLSLFKIFIFATASYSAASAFYFLASRYIGTGVAMVIFFSFPVFVTLFSWLLDGLRLTKPTLLSLLAVMLGLFCLKGENTAPINMIGLGWGLVAAMSYAAYIYMNRHSAKALDARLLTLLVCLGNTLLFFSLSWYEHSFLFPSTVTAWFYIVAIGIFATVLPIQLLLTGLKYIHPVKASVLSVFEPVVSVLMGLIVLHESMSSMQSLGILIVLLGAICIQFERHQKDEGPCN